MPSDADLKPAEAYDLGIAAAMCGHSLHVRGLESSLSGDDHPRPRSSRASLPGNTNASPMPSGPPETYQRCGTLSTCAHTQNV